MPECTRCKGSGEVAIRATTGSYVGPGPVPDDGGREMKSSWRESRSFGPIVTHKPDGTFTPSCDWCVFRIGTACTYAKPSRDIPDPSHTPEWCEMRESILEDARQAAERAAAERERG